MVLGDIVVDAQSDVMFQELSGIVIPYFVRIGCAICQFVCKLIVVIVCLLAMMERIEHVDFPLLVGIEQGSSLGILIAVLVGKASK